MFFDSNLTRSTPLSNIKLAAFTWDAVYLILYILHLPITEWQGNEIISSYETFHILRVIEVWILKTLNVFR
jgi:hypothetical protein